MSKDQFKKESMNIMNGWNTQNEFKNKFPNESWQAGKTKLFMKEVV